ncbi:DoxX-like family protein [Catalinimonas alkaloidigena]|uniref:DoxX-like family protein n=1 Tax=Catalinimonas alkaloidigena TaxID=1075417 RepID=A0A1G9GDE1_9BACT|nr:DoxX family protein [Catalinimonas alkaloidigena]SDK98303.1 DoxX-like family protein [Catalinimonas alkaloidigena]
MAKRNQIIYWIATLWLALGMGSTGAVQILHQPAEVENITQLGYPPYFLTLLGFWKILGVVAVLLPKFPLLKEWAYAGFFFAMSGATFSRIAAGDSFAALAPSLLLLVLTVVSWYFRPANRKVASVHLQPRQA